jgi:hypothetical protein
MEIIISILIYLGALVPNNSYTIEQINMIEAENSTKIETVQQDEELTNQILKSNLDNFSIDQSKEVVEVWEDEDWEYN